MKNLKIVILESPYDCWNNPFVGDFLKDLIGIKLRGYGKEYPYGVIPIDGADLISTHLAVCRTSISQKLIPIMGIRWTSLKKCRLHYHNFPGLSLLQQAGAAEHLNALENIILNIDNNGGDLFYSGSLSIDPLERTNKEQSLLIREILTMLYVNYQKERNYPELMAGGTMRFKIEKWLSSLGHLPLSTNEHELNPIRVKHLAGETVKVMHLKKFSFEALKIAQKWQHLWEERLHIQENLITDLKKAG